VGEHLLRRLAGGGQLVVGTGYTQSITVPGARVVSIDLSQAKLVLALIRDVRPAVIYHCAALTDVAKCQKEPALARQGIVEATENLVAAVRQYNPDTPIVAMSTDLVFDGERAPYRETDRADPLSIYGQLKLESEGLILGLNRGTVLRTSLVYGLPVTHKSSFLGWMVDTLSQGRALQLFEDEVRTPILVDDLCDMIIGLASEQGTGVWHAGGPQRLDRAAMGEMVCSALGIGTDLVHRTRLSESTYLAPRPRDVSLDCSKLLLQMNIEPIRFEQALASMPLGGSVQQ